MLYCSLGVRLQQIVSFVDLAVEVSGVGQQLSVIDDLLIQKHSRDTWSELLSKDLVNWRVNGVADEVVPVLLVGRREPLFNLRSIQLRKCNTALGSLRCRWTPRLLRILLLIRSSLGSVCASVLLGTASSSLLTSSLILATPGDFVPSVLLIGSRLLKMLLLLHFLPIIKLVI